MNLIHPEKTYATGLSRACECCPAEGCAFHDLQPLQAHQHSIRLDRGGRLESAGSGACLQFWVVIEGTAATCTAFEDGRRQIVGLEEKGDVICAAMAGQGTQNWLEALSPCEICEIDLSPEGARLRHDAAFLAATFMVAHRRLTQAQAHISTLGRLDSRERVLLFLAQMASRAGKGLVTLHMSREDIADYLGLNAETVSRILSRIKKTGLVKFLSPTEYVVPDMGEIARRLPVPIQEAAP